MPIVAEEVHSLTFEPRSPLRSLGMRKGGQKLAQCASLLGDVRLPQAEDVSRCVIMTA